MDVHHPCYPPERYRVERNVGDVTQTMVSDWYSALLREPETLSQSDIENLRRLYIAAIDYVDDQIQRLLNALDAQGMLDDTCVIITSDHGELFGEYGEYGKPERMYDELLRVPLLVTNGPTSLDDATDQLVSLLDIPPIIHDVLGVEVPDVYEGQHPGHHDPRTTIIGEHEVQGDVVVGARSTEWLYESDEIRGDQRLFDLRQGEAQPVSPDHPDGLGVKETVNNRLGMLDVDARFLDDEVEGDIQSRLENLGYL
jgi:arylsulfatase A-like enzyme